MERSKGSHRWKKLRLQRKILTEKSVNFFKVHWKKLYGRRSNFQFIAETWERYDGDANGVLDLHEFSNMCLDYYMALPEVERLEPHMRAAFISRPLRSIAFRTARLVFQDIELDSSGDLEWSTFKRIFFQSLGFPEDLVQAGGDHEDSRKGATPISVKKMDEETLNIVENYANPETEVYDRGAKTVVRKYFEKLVCATPLGQFIKKDNLKKRRIYNQTIEMGPEGRAESQELSNVLVDMFAYFNVTAEKQKDVCKAFKIIMFEPGDIVFNQG
eukprot:928786_1